MTKFKCEGFKSVAKGQEYNGYMVVESISDAAKVFADRLARRYGKTCRSIINQNSWTDSSAMFQCTIVRRDGVIESEEWLYVYI